MKIYIKQILEEKMGWEVGKMFHFTLSSFAPLPNIRFNIYRNYKAISRRKEKTKHSKTKIN